MKMTYGEFKDKLSKLTDEIRSMIESIEGADGVENKEVEQKKGNARMYIIDLEEALTDDFGEILDD